MSIHGSSCTSSEAASVRTSIKKKTRACCSFPSCQRTWSNLPTVSSTRSILINELSEQRGEATTSAGITTSAWRTGLQVDQLQISRELVIFGNSVGNNEHVSTALIRSRGLHHLEHRNECIQSRTQVSSSFGDDKGPSERRHFGWLSGQAGGKTWWVSYGWKNIRVGQRESRQYFLSCQRPSHFPCLTAASPAQNIVLTKEDETRGRRCKGKQEQTGALSEYACRDWKICMSRAPQSPVQIESYFFASPQSFYLTSGATFKPFPSIFKQLFKTVEESYNSIAFSLLVNNWLPWLFVTNYILYCQQTHSAEQLLMTCSR
jgi:hypothetical protein